MESRSRVGCTDGNPTRGLIPQGWYCYIRDFTRSPPPSAGAAPPATPDLVTKNADAQDAPCHQAHSWMTGALTTYLKRPLLQCHRRSSKQQAHPDLSIVNSRWRATNLSHPRSRSHTSRRRRKARAHQPVSADSSGPSCSRESSRPHTPNSADAALVDADPAAVWQTSEDVHSKLVTEVESSTSIPAVNPTAIDGLPAPSDPDHPIDWSAMAESQVWAKKNESLQSTMGARQFLARQLLLHSRPPIPALLPAPTGRAASLAKRRSIASPALSPAAPRTTCCPAPTLVRRSALGSWSERSQVASRPLGSQLSQVAEEEREGAADLPAGLETKSYESTLPSSSGWRGEKRSEPTLCHRGRRWPKVEEPAPCFLVQVHHPEKRTRLNGMQEYTVYHVTSTYPIDAPDGVPGEQMDSAAQATGTVPYDPLGGPYPPGAQVTVVRRFTQFEWLHLVLTRHYSALLIPPLPEKQYSGASLPTLSRHAAPTSRCGSRVWSDIRCCVIRAHSILPQLRERERVAKQGRNSSSRWSPRAFPRAACVCQHVASRLQL